MIAHALTNCGHYNSIKLRLARYCVIWSCLHGACALKLFNGKLAPAFKIASKAIPFIGARKRHNSFRSLEIASYIRWYILILNHTSFLNTFRFSMDISLKVRNSIKLYRQPIIS